MADELKRVGLVFKADGAVDFKKSLKEVNAAVQENRSSFKLAKSQWDESTKAADKLKDRQEYLAKQTKDYADKVLILKEQLNELEGAEKRDEAAIAKKRTELNNTKATLSSYEKGLAEVNEKLKSGTLQIEEYAKKIEAIGAKATDAGKKLSTRVSAPIAAIGGLAIKSAMELDEGYDIIITKTGATGDALEEMNKVADEVFGSMPTEMTDVGTAVGEVNTRFASTGEELKKTSEVFLKFAEINDVDLNTSIGTTDKIMTQFGIDTKNVSEVLGIITKRAQETGIGADVLQNSLSQNSATLKELGFGMEESINLLAQFEENGVDASVALKGMQKSITNMAKDGLSADESIKKIIISIQKAKTETEAINIASETFGTKGAVQMVDAIRSGRLSLENLSDTLSNYGQTVNDTWQTTQDPWDKMKTSTNQLKVAGSQLAGQLFEVLAPIINMLTEKVQAFSNWFGKLDEGQKQTIVTIGLLVVAIGPLLIIFGTLAGSTMKIITLTSKVITVAGKVPGILKTVGTGAKFVWAILSANPIGVVITVVGGLIAAFITLYNKCDWFREGVDKIFSKIKKVLGGAVDWMKDIFDFEWKLPKIKLPHFKMKGSFSLSPPSVPSLSIDWYAKGGILKSPTIFGKNGDSLMGGGEAGPEAVLPIALLKNYIREEMQGNNENLVKVFVEALKEIKLVAENNIYLGDRKIAEVLTEMVIKKMSEKAMNMKGMKGRQYV
ncbi:phage tail tape measure protein [Faecalimonas sp.]